MTSGAATTAPDAAALCTHCALCCDGTLFEEARAYPEDQATLSRYGMTLAPDRAKPAFVQPCPQLQGCACAIYAERFVTCRRFRCALLKRLDAREITLDQGLATIATARALIAAVEPAARLAGPRRALRKATLAWNGLADPGARNAMARRHLAIAALDHFVSRHFRKPEPPSSER
jgi:hypothetical protein